MRAFVLLLIVLGCAHAVELSVALKPTVRLRGAVATLGDVAELAGDPKLVAACAAVPIQELPDLAAYTIDEAKVRAALAGRLPPRALTVTGACALGREALTISEDDLARAVRAQIALSGAGEQEVTIVRSSGARVVAADDAQPPALVAEPLAHGDAGELPYRVRILRAGRELDRALVVARVRLFRPSPVATRAIAKGETLAPGDMRDERIEVRVDDPPIAAGGADQLVGWVATRDIADGAALTEHCLRRRPAVRAGEKIELVFTSGSFELTADGTALADGAPGDVIQARREHDRKLVEVRVVADGRALVNFK